MNKKRIGTIISLIALTTPLVATIACAHPTNWVTFDLASSYGNSFVDNIISGTETDEPNAIFSSITSMKMEVEKENTEWEMELDIIGKDINTQNNLSLEIDGLMDQNKKGAPSYGFAWIEYEFNDQNEVYIPDLAAVQETETEKLNVIHLIYLFQKYFPLEFKPLLNEEFVIYFDLINAN